MPLRLQAGRIAAAAAAFAVLAAVYAHLSLQSTVNSDGANEVLQGLAFWHGNVLLHGWWLAQDTFYFDDAPLYGLIARIDGLGPWAVHQGAGLAYAAAVVAAALLARRGALIALAVLALPPPLLLQGQMHLLGVAYVLFSLLLLEEHQGRWWTVATSGLLLFAAMASDPLMTLLFAAPIAAAAAVRSDRRRDLLPITVAAALLGSAFPFAAGLVGGFTLVRPEHVALAGPVELQRHLELLVRGVLRVFHADVVDAPGEAISWLRLPAVAAAVAGVVVAARRLRGRDPDDLVQQVLVLACALDVAAFLFTTQVVDLDSSRFLGPFALCGAVLAGRELPPLLISSRLRTAAVLAGIVMAAGLPLQLTRPATVPPTAPLERWLVARGLTSGFGSYWEASIVTLDTEGQVSVRCIDGGVRATPERWFQDSAWFARGGSVADFIVLDPTVRAAHIDEAAARADFGDPAEVYRVGRYEVLIYPHDLLPDLQT